MRLFIRRCRHNIEVYRPEFNTHDLNWMEWDSKYRDFLNMVKQGCRNRDIVNFNTLLRKPYPY